MNEEEFRKKLEPKLENKINKLEKKSKVINVATNVANLAFTLFLGGACIPHFASIPVNTFKEFKEKGNTPFVFDKDTVTCLCDEHYFNSRGRDEHEIKNVDFDPVQEPNRNMLSYHSKWKAKGEHFEQVVKIYQIDESVYKKISEKLVNNIPVENIIEDILDKPTLVKVKNERDIPKSELKRDAYFQATIYKSKENSCVIHKESVSENAMETVWYLLYTILLELPYVAVPAFIEFGFLNASFGCERVLQSRIDDKIKVYKKLREKK